MAGVRPLRTSWLIVGNENLALNRCRLSLGQRSAARGLHPVAKRATPRRGGPLDRDGGCPGGHTRRRPASGTPNAEYTVAHAQVSTEPRWTPAASEGQIPAPWSRREPGFAFVCSQGHLRSIGGPKTASCPRLRGQMCSHHHHLTDEDRSAGAAR